MAAVTQIMGEDMVVEEDRGRDRRLLILAGDPYVRDACAALADELHCDLYSTAYVENIDNIVKKFQPKGIVIDLVLFEDDGIHLHELLLNAKPPLNILFLEGDDEELAPVAQTLAKAIGLNVKGSLRRPISENRLEHVLKKLV